MTIIHFGCLHCPEPKTTIERGDHISINVTSVNYGAKVRVVISCSVCGFVSEVTEHVEQVSKQYLDDLLGNTEDK